MTLKGNDVFNGLINDLKKNESVSSSHWNHYHRDFSFIDGRLSGVKGFGHNNRYYGNFSNWIHYVFQSKYRKMSSGSPFFKQLNKRALALTKKQKRTYSLDVLRQSLTLDLIHQKIDFSAVKSTVIIGDGFGTMTSLLLDSQLVDKIYLINLRKTLIVDLLYLKKILGEEKFNNDVALIRTAKESKEIDHTTKVIAIEAENYSILKHIQKELVINIASFQEMDMEVVDRYFEYIYNQQSSPFYFYLCNRENKYLPDGSLISFGKYKFDDKDTVILDELCPWHQDFYSLKPPFFRTYDGPIRHQLRKINHPNKEKD